MGVIVSVLVARDIVIIFKSLLVMLGGSWMG